MHVAGVHIINTCWQCRMTREVSIERLSKESWVFWAVILVCFFHVIVSLCQTLLHFLSIWFIKHILQTETYLTFSCVNRWLFYTHHWLFVITLVQQSSNVFNTISFSLLTPSCICILIIIQICNVLLQSCSNYCLYETFICCMLKKNALLKMFLIIWNNFFHDCVPLDVALCCPAFSSFSLWAKHRGED